MKPLKVTFIGAGSIGFTRTLLTDLLSVKEFSNIEIAFTDIDEKNLDMVTQLCNRDIRANGLSIQIQSTTQRRQALRGANYVINCARIGGLEAFKSDVDIPLKYGVDQCVGDTLCAGWHYVRTAGNCRRTGLLPRYSPGLCTGLHFAQLRQSKRHAYLGMQQIRRRSYHRTVSRGTQRS